MRGRSSYESPPPTRGQRSCSPGGGRTSLLVRNISRDTRPEDLRGPFEQYGPVKDVYLPRDYYTGEPRGFGFIQFLDHRDAMEAQQKMNQEFIKGRQVCVVFAEETRKRPEEMRLRESRHRSDYRRSPPPRGRSRSISRSPRSRSPRYSSVSPRRRSRSYSPPERRYPPPKRRVYDRPYYPSPPAPRREYLNGPSPPMPYRRDQMWSHGRPMHPFMHPAGRFDMISGHRYHGNMEPMYPHYHRGLSGTSRGWEM